MIIATRIKPSFLIERELGKIVAGIDEAGRGPLSGPVVAACVILNADFNIKDIDDSKKLSAQKRAEIFLRLQRSTLFGIGVVDERTIDKINILNATKLAMQQSFLNMCQKSPTILTPDWVIVDGNFIPDINCPATAIVKGDSKSLSIAAASIIAKETRDQIMIDLDQEFPQYNWRQNKGYPTASHFAAIRKFGASKYHRQSFTLFKNASN